MPWLNIFQPKNYKYPVRVGGLTTAGARAFEKARGRLRKLSGIKNISDADTVEFLARGEEETRKVIEKQNGPAAAKE